MGYGPVCAANYELPWGNKRQGTDVEQEILQAERENRAPRILQHAGRGPRIAYECDSPETACEVLGVSRVRLTSEGYEEVTDDGEFMSGSQWA